jgi:hypothetical protein
MYTLVNQNREEKYDDYHSNEEDGEMQWTKDAITKKFINIGLIVEITIHESITGGLFQNQPRYYVNMLKILKVINLVFENLVENLE